MIIDNLKIAIIASLKAGKEIMKVYNSSFNTEIKEDKSPVTEADKKANDVINSYLVNTEFPIISEENLQIDYSVRKVWDTCWIVDPLDGTKEFIKRNDEFTVNIALVTKGKPEFGVIYIPVTKTIYVGHLKNKVAFKAVLNSHDNSIEDILNLAKDLKPKDRTNLVQIVSSRSHMSQEILDFVKILEEKGKAVKIVSRGSSLKFCIVADGGADMYPRFTPTMEWDTAAGQAICNSVGIEVISKESNKSLVYNKENLFNPSFLVLKKDG